MKTRRIRYLPSIGGKGIGALAVCLNALRNQLEFCISDMVLGHKTHTINQNKISMSVL